MSNAAISGSALCPVLQVQLCLPGKYESFRTPGSVVDHFFGRVLLLGRQLYVEAHASVPFLQVVHLPNSLPLTELQSWFFLKSHSSLEQQAVLGL
jgi:hypothetical protein